MLCCACCLFAQMKIGAWETLLQEQLPETIHGHIARRCVRVLDHSPTSDRRHHSQRTGERMGSSLQRWLDEVPNSHQRRIDQRHGATASYLFKYITKAEPGLSFVLKQEGAREVTQYQNARVMGSCEAAGRLLSMPHHSNVPAVKRLDIHVKGKETIFFNSDDTVDELAEKVASKSTTLLAWFNFNDKNQSDGCRTLLYRDFPTYFSYVKGEWKLRQGYEYSERRVSLPAQGHNR